jgi:hypothetical protein
MKNKNIISVFLFLFFLFFLDFLFFRKLLWLVPNEFAWNAHHFYNFNYEWKRVSSQKKKNPRLFIVGSSIAYYSIDQVKLKEELHKKLGKEVDVEYFSYAGKSPLYAYLFMEELLKMKPDMVLYPVNFIDFRLHRAFVLKPGTKQEDMNEEELLRDAVTDIESPQSKILFPWETLVEMWDYLDWHRRGELFVSHIFKFYGYKDIYWEAIEGLYNHRFGRNSSYHAYAGVQIPERVNSLGWTHQFFSFQVADKIRKDGFWIEVVDMILKKGPLGIKIEGAGHVQDLRFDSPGWKKIILDEAFFEADNKPFLKVSLSHVWYSYEAEGFLKDYHRDPMGVRLTQIFGLDEPKKNMQYQREERYEDLRYIDMGDDTYREYFFYRLMEDLPNRPGIRYLFELAEAKKKLGNEKFRPILHFQYLKKFAERLEREKIPLLLVNNPENPISLEWYNDTEWYKDYLVFLKSLESDSIRFVDWKDVLKMQDFSDFHHMTYPGMEKMNSRYATEIIEFSAF